MIYIYKNIYMKVIIIRLQRPESGCVVLALACVGVCVVRPFPGGRHSHAARDETGARPARARPAHARPAQAMRLTANTKRKLCFVVSVVEALNNRVYYEGMK